MKKELDTFFNSTLTNALEKLSVDSREEWGTMTVIQMIEHLIQSCNMIHQNNTKILIQEEYIPKAIAFLYSEKEIQKGIKVDETIGYSFSEDDKKDLEELKSKLLNEVKKMISFLETNTSFKAIHPYFGELNSEQWFLFQKKHFTHHLRQFGLL